MSALAYMKMIISDDIINTEMVHHYTKAVELLC